MSHFRRGWQWLQLKKLGNPFKLKNSDVRNINSFLELVKENKKDIYGIEYQFDNWINSKQKIPILFLNFNDILQKKDLLDNFLGKKLNYDNFENKDRESKIINNLEVISIYDELYKK